MSKSRAADFLQNMAHDVADQPPAVAPAPTPKAKSFTGRDGRKHIGGYLDDATVEKVAVLRARLKLDNSELLKLAVDELY